MLSFRSILPLVTNRRRRGKKVPKIHAKKKDRKTDRQTGRAAEKSKYLSSEGSKLEKKKQRNNHLFQHEDYFRCCYCCWCCCSSQSNQKRSTSAWQFVANQFDRVIDGVLINVMYSHRFILITISFKSIPIDFDLFKIQFELIPIHCLTDNRIYYQQIKSYWLKS